MTGHTEIVPVAYDSAVAAVSTMGDRSGLRSVTPAG